MSSKAPVSTNPDESGPSILGMTSEAFVEASGTLGIPKVDALSAYRAFYREGRITNDWFALEEMPMGRREIEALENRPQNRGVRRAAPSCTEPQKAPRPCPRAPTRPARPPSPRP